MSQGTQSSVASPEHILNIRPQDVRVRWGTSMPSGGLGVREEELAQEAAAQLGYDEVILRSNIHGTTGTAHGGFTFDNPHITVAFESSRYGRQTNRTGHVYVHVWSPRLSAWTEFPTNKRLRGRNYDYNSVHIESVTFLINLASPKQLAEQEIEAQRQREAQEARRRQREEEERARRSASSNTYGGGAYEDSTYGGSTYTTPAGWYPNTNDPSGRTEAYWDGVRWTGQIAQTRYV